MTDPLAHLMRELATRYRIERDIGRGGMATVYLARDLRHEREVALKVLRPDLAQHLGSDRFLREIRIAARLQHPHILPLYDSGGAGELLYYVMPYVRGESLRDLLTRERRLAPERAIELTTEVADALTYAHREGVVHRDIKPENVLLSEGHALVADFGIAKAVSLATDEPLTRTGIAIGTPGYMSPEQAAGSNALDERTDVFSLACVVFEMLVGDVPARWVPDEEVRRGRFLRASAEHRRYLDRLPGPIEPALVRAMAMDPDARFRTPTEFAAALSTPPAPARRFGETEARDILGRAAELEAAEPTHPGFGLETMKRIADEVDIPIRHVEVAARERDRLPDLAPLKPPRLFGLNVGINLSRSVGGEVPASELPVLVEMVEETLGTHGRVETRFGSDFIWTSDVTSVAQRGMSPTRVQIVARSGYTRLTISEDRTPVVATSVGAAAALAAAAALPLAGMGWQGTALMPAVGIIGVGMVGLFRATWRRRREHLSRLLDRLAQHVSVTAGR